MSSDSCITPIAPPSATIPTTPCPSCNTPPPGGLRVNCDGADGAPIAIMGVLPPRSAAETELDMESVAMEPELHAIKSLLERLDTDAPPAPQNFVCSNIQPPMAPGVAAEKADEDAKRWTSIARHNALEEACAQRDNGKREGNLPTISVTLQSFTAVGQPMKQIHAGAILLTESIDDTHFTYLRGCSGHLLEDAEHAGNLYIALARVKRKTDLRWEDLRVGEPLEVLYEGTWYQASVSESCSSFEGSDRVQVYYDGFPEDQAFEEIEKGENGAWKRRLRAPLPALHLYGLRCLEVKGQQQGIRKEHNRRFKCYGSVRDKLQVLQSLYEAKDMPPGIVKSIAQVRMRQPALAFENVRPTYGDCAYDHAIAASSVLNDMLDAEQQQMASGANLGRVGGHVLRTTLPDPLTCKASTNASQRDVISSIHFDVEAVQGPPGTGKSTMICTILEENLPGKRTLVTCVQNKAVFAVADKLFAQSSVFFVIAGARNLEQYRAKGEDGWPLLAKRCTSFGRSLRSALRLGDPERLGPSLAYKMAKTCSRLARFWYQNAAKRAQQRYQRLIRQASESRKMLNEMGIVQAGKDSWTSSDEDEEDQTLHWRCMMVLGRWLRLCSMMRYGKQQKARQASWIALTDALLQHNAVEALVPLVEAQAQVWLATVDSGHKVRVRRPLDVVILDEAGSMPEWKMPLLTRFQPRLLLLIGDHKQLPPFTSCEGGFRPVSVLERMADVLSSTVMPVKMLTTQYRMHPDICRFVSAHFYDERLETDKSRALAAREQPEPPIVWRTHGGGESRAEHSKSTENREEARIICGEILPALFADPHCAGKKIVIITMYKAQLRLLEQMLTEHQHTGKAAVMTVDSAQGSEADIVILSLVRSNAQGAIGHARDRQRINVALSRAKDRLLIVGNAQCFLSDRVWRNLSRAASHVHHSS